MKNTTGPHILLDSKDQQTRIIGDEVSTPMEVLQVIFQSLDGKINSLTGEFRTKFHALLEAIEQTHPNLYRVYQEILAKKTAFGLYKALDKIKETGDLEAIQRHNNIIDAMYKNAQEEGLAGAFNIGVEDYMKEWGKTK